METTIYAFGIFFAYFVRRKLFFSLFVEIFLMGKSKLHTTCSKNDFEEDYFSWNVPKPLWTLKQNFPGLYLDILGWVVKFSLYVSIEIFWGDFFSEFSYFLILSVLGQNVFGCSSKFFCQGCQNGVLSVLRKNLRIFIPKICLFRILRAYRNNLRIFSGNFLVLIYFWTWAKNFGGKSFDGNVKRAFEVCKESIWGKILFGAFF